MSEPDDNGWFPIATAPKTGAFIDLWCELGDPTIAGSRVADAFWYSPEKNNNLIGIAPDAKLPAWLSPNVTDQCGEMLEIDGATHWRFAPQPPKRT